MIKQNIYKANQLDSKCNDEIKLINDIIVNLSKIECKIIDIEILLELLDKSEKIISGLYVNTNNTDTINIINNYIIFVEENI